MQLLERSFETIGAKSIPWWELKDMDGSNENIFGYLIHKYNKIRLLNEWARKGQFWRP